MAKPPVNVLVFNQQSTRDSIELLRVVHKTLAGLNTSGQSFQYAIFCTNVTYKNNSWKVGKYFSLQLKTQRLKAVLLTSKPPWP